MWHISAVILSWLNDLEDMGQGQRSLCTAHPLMLLIICAKYGNCNIGFSNVHGLNEGHIAPPNMERIQSRTVDITEQTQHVGRMSFSMNKPTKWCKFGQVRTDRQSENSIPPFQQKVNSDDGDDDDAIDYVVSHLPLSSQILGCWVQCNIECWNLQLNPLI